MEPNSDLMQSVSAINGSGSPTRRLYGWQK
jgi:hypothetical protein